MHFVLKLFPEIVIKTGPVRKRFTRMLRDNLRTQFKAQGLNVSVVRHWDMMEVVGRPDVQYDDGAQQLVSEVLAHTPGIGHFYRVDSYSFTDLHDIYEKTAALWLDALADKTFCVRVKRHGNHDFTSTEIERYVGGGLNQNSNAVGVRLKNPDITVNLEVRDDTLFVIRQRTQGMGGYPLGTQDAVLSLISGGFDSTVASYLTMKRGLLTHYCFFNLGGHAHELGVKEVAFYLWNKFGSSHRVRFVSIPFDKVVAEILHSIHHSQMGVVLKRMMLRVAEQVAAELNVPALVTGESVAQVSSQTLPNLSVIDSVTDALVLRPLVTSDKESIIATTRAIGAEELVASIPEYCGVISQKPTTRAKKERIVFEESKFDFSVLDAAFANRRLQNIDEIVADLESGETPIVVNELPANGVVLDIRHPHEEELRPLKLDGVTIKSLPFYRLDSEFGALDTLQTYYLYCDKGVMSQLHAAHLLANGRRNVAVYRPAKLPKV